VSDNDVKRATGAVWGASPAGTTFGGDAHVGTREFFDRVLQRRSTYEMPWLSAIVPFATMAGRRVVELGCGAGYDAYAFATAGADYTGVDITPQNPVRTRDHLALYGYACKTVQGDAEQLPFVSAHFDTAFSNGVLHHTPDLGAAVRETFRVLRSGGEFYIILYHKTSIFHWVSLFLFDHILQGNYRRRTMAERLSMIEYTTSDERPLVNVYRRGELRRVLRAAGFQVKRTWVRKLTPEDMPQQHGLGRVWQHVPQRLLDQVGRAFGWYVIAHAVKP